MLLREKNTFSLFIPLHNKVDYKTNAKVDETIQLLQSFVCSIKEIISELVDLIIEMLGINP